jgi:phenylacetate-CoA ligase
MTIDRRDKTRQRWLETLRSYRRDFGAPASEEFWSPSLDTASRDELTAIQNDKLAALTPFLYENSGFYRRRFDRLGLTPDDIRNLADLPKWPVVDKDEMVADATEHPPYGAYTTMSEEIWRERGWMQFSSSGSTGLPRVFRYSHIDRDYWEWANARALHSMGIRRGDTVFPIGGYGPHVWLWGVLYAFARMGIAVIPGGGMDARARASIIERFGPSVVACTPSYALYLGQVMKDMGGDPNKSAVRTLFTGGEPALGIDKTRERLEDLWGCRLVEFYGCTEVAPHSGGYTCPASSRPDRPVSMHLMEDLQIWELVDDAAHQGVPDGVSGLTVCTSLNSESSPQLRFLIGDYTRLDRSGCDCGRTHVRAIGAFTGRADDIINIRGVKLLPSHIEQAVRAVPGTGDEFEIVLSTKPDGLDVMDIRVEHPDRNKVDHVAMTVADEVRTRCEIRVDVEVLAPGTLPKTEFKAKRVRDERSG